MHPSSLDAPRAKISARILAAIFLNELRKFPA
jgi:hypothetical protein